MITLPAPLKPLTDRLIAEGAFPVVVGGYVRDALLGIASKDIDIEVYSIPSLETLQQILSPYGSVNIVGKSFGVLKMTIEGYDIDFSLPRTESKKAPGHKGFEIMLSSQLDFTTAALRRDFTINAMGFDINSSYLLDPYKGQRDLHEQKLRCVNTKTFVEDPLRVLRAVQMAARFHLECDDALMLLCRKMVKESALDELPKERVFEEFRKLLLKSSAPSIGFRIMARIGLLDYYPELAALRRVGQDPKRHPEGDAWEHTLMSVDVMAGQRTGDTKRDLILMLAVLCHAFGKPEAQLQGVEDHGLFGVDPTFAFIGRLTDEKGLADAVAALVRHHADPARYYRDGADDAQIRRLALTVPLEDLVLVAKANHLGRGTPEARLRTFTPGEWLLQRAIRANATPHSLEPLLQGRDLIKAGFRPSADFKTILDAAFDAQLEGEFETYTGAMAWLSAYRLRLG